MSSGRVFPFNSLADLYDVVLASRSQSATMFLIVSYYFTSFSILNSDENNVLPVVVRAHVGAGTYGLILRCGSPRLSTCVAVKVNREVSAAGASCREATIYQYLGNCSGSGKKCVFFFLLIMRVIAQ